MHLLNIGSTAHLPKGRIDGLLPAGTKLRGTVEFSGTLWVEAELHGDIRPRSGEAAVLIIGPQGRIFGNIEADQITIYGQVAGRIRSHGSLVFEPSAHVVAEEIAHQGFIIRTGAHVEGAIRPSASTQPSEPAAARSNVQLLRAELRRGKPGAAAIDQTERPVGTVQS